MRNRDCNVNVCILGAFSWAFEHHAQHVGIDNRSSLCKTVLSAYYGFDSEVACIIKPYDGNHIEEASCVTKYNTSRQKSGAVK